MTLNPWVCKHFFQHGQKAAIGKRKAPGDPIGIPRVIANLGGEEAEAGVESFHRMTSMTSRLRTERVTDHMRRLTRSRTAKPMTAPRTESPMTTTGLPDQVEIQGVTTLATDGGMTTSRRASLLRIAQSV
jgi:hypothetical protein